MRQHHYLGFDSIIGESLWYVARVGNEWVALLGWGSAALKCGVRDQWIGWDRELQWRRLHLVANNVRFLILPAWNRPNLASRILALNLRRLRQDWGGCYGHPAPLAETLLDRPPFRGAGEPAAGSAAPGGSPRLTERRRPHLAHE